MSLYDEILSRFKEIVDIIDHLTDESKEGDEAAYKELLEGTQQIHRKSAEVRDMVLAAIMESTGGGEEDDKEPV